MDAHPPQPLPKDVPTMSEDDSRPAPAVALPHIPGYHIVGELGRGAVGVVYKARQTALDRPVAVKMLLRELGATPEQRQRFRSEARAVARLHHPSIVQVYEVGEHEGAPYLCLEYVEGGSLADRLAGRPLEPREAARLVLRLAQAVEAAHRAGVVHRDLKPANVLLTADGVPKVGDFGLALRQGEARQTQSGAILGTPSYMAPEQARGEKNVGPAADVYALGAILYEMLCGRAPFLGTAHAVLMDLLSREPTPPSRLNPQAPPDLEVICLKCLEKEPGRRYPSAAALEEDLGRFLEGRPITARPIGSGERAWRWTRRNPLLAASAGLAAVALVVATALSAWVAVIQTERAGEQSAHLREIEEEQAHTQAALERSENSFRLLQTSEANRRESVRLAAHMALEQAEKVRDLPNAPEALLWYARALELAGSDDEELVRQTRDKILVAWRQSYPLIAALSGGEGISEVVVSPDGARLATAQGQEVRFWDAVTGAPLSEALIHPEPVKSLAFSPDGKQLITAAGKKARLWDSQAGKVLGEPIEAEDHLRFVGFSHDGKVLLMGSGGPVAFWGAASRKQLNAPPRIDDNHFPRPFVPQFVPQDPSRATAAVALPKDRTAVVKSTFFPVSWVEVLDGFGRKDALVRIDQKHGIALLTASSDGKYLLTAAENAAQLWDAATGKKAQSPWAHAQRVSAVAISPDGKTAATGRADGNVRLWDVANDKLTGPTLPHPAEVTCLAFSPQSDLLLTGCADGTARLWELEQGKPVGAPLRHPAPLAFVGFAASGTTVVTRTRLEQKGQTLERGAGPVTLWRLGVTPFNRPCLELAFCLSPDGHTLAARCERSVLAWDADSGTPLTPERVLPGTVEHLVFSPDGKLLAAADFTSLALWAPRQRDQRPFLFNFAEQKPPLRGQQILGLSFTAEGDHVLAVTAGKPVAVSYPLNRQFSVGRFMSSRDPPANPWEERAKYSRNGIPLDRNVIYPGAEWVQRWPLPARGTPEGALAVANRSLGKCGPRGVGLMCSAEAPDKPELYRHDLVSGRRLDDRPVGQERDGRQIEWQWLGATLLKTSDDRPRKLLVWNAAVGKFEPAPDQLAGLDDPPVASDDGRVRVRRSTVGIEIVEAQTGRVTRSLHLLDRYPASRVTLWAQVFTGMELDMRGKARCLLPEEWAKRRVALERMGGFPLP